MGPKQAKRAHHVSSASAAMRRQPSSRVERAHTIVDTLTSAAVLIPIRDCAGGDRRRTKGTSMESRSFRRSSVSRGKVQVEQKKEEKHDDEKEEQEEEEHELFPYERW